MKYELLDYDKVWLDFINNDNIKKIIDEGRQADFIGKKVIINNKETPDYITWQIADFSHDDSGYTVDLIAVNTVISKAFEDTDNNNYTTSDIRRWLNDNYYDGFSDDIKEKMDTMVVQTNTSSGLVTTNDKVKVLSCREMNLFTYYPYMPTNEGTPYPIFPSCPWDNRDNNVNKRVRSGADSYYWLRSRYTDNMNFVWIVDCNGSLDNSLYANSSQGIVPVIRFKNV